MLDYLGTSERLQEVMTYYKVEYEEEQKRMKKAREAAKNPPKSQEG